MNEDSSLAANEVQAVDPLFLMEHGRFYNETPVRAERVEARTFASAVE